MTTGDIIKLNDKNKKHGDTKKISQITATSKPKEIISFPSKIATHSDSTAYTKKLIITALSNITYLRAIFPEDYYVERKFEGLHCRVLKPLSEGFTQTKILSEWLEGAFDAIDKKYLSCLSLIIYENSMDTENILENYDFNISYTEKDANLTLNFMDAKKSGSKCKLDACRLLRGILCTVESLSDLPDRIYMSIRLFYYEDVTPIDYEPNGYISSEFEKYNYSNGRVSIHLGQTQSVWHKCSASVTVDESMLRRPDEFQTIDETFDDSNEIEDHDSGIKTMLDTPKISDKPKMYKHQDLDKSIKMLHDQSYISTNTELEEGDLMNLINKKIYNLSVTTTLPINPSDADSIVSVSSLTKNIDCGCMLNDEKNLDLLKCSSCNTWQHAICYNYKIDNFEDLIFLQKNIKIICLKCALENNSTPTDKTHIGLTKSEIYELCILRRVIVWLYELNTKTVNQQEIISNFNINSNMVTKLHQKLESQKILIFHNKKEKIYRIDKTCLKNYIFKNMKTSHSPAINQNETLNKSVNFELPEERDSQIQKKKSSKRPIEQNEGEIQMSPESTKNRGRTNNDSPKRKRKSSITRQAITA